MTTTTTHTDDSIAATNEAFVRLAELATAMINSEDPMERAKLASQLHLFLRDDMAAAMSAERLTSLFALRKRGASYREIGKALDISVSRVHQLIHDPRY